MMFMDFDINGVDFGPREREISPEGEFEKGDCK